MKNTITYNKLIRDKIPAIIQESGKGYKTHIADTKEYQTMLLEKLLEEAREMKEEPCLEELADILEVIEAIKCAFEFNETSLQKKQTDKRNARGGFLKRIILEYTYE